MISFLDQRFYPVEKMKSKWFNFQVENIPEDGDDTRFTSVGMMDLNSYDSEEGFEVEYIVNPMGMQQHAYVIGELSDWVKDFGSLGLKGLEPSPDKCYHFSVAGYKGEVLFLHESKLEEKLLPKAAYATIVNFFFGKQSEETQREIISKLDVKAEFTEDGLVRLSDEHLEVIKRVMKYN